MTAAGDIGVVPVSSYHSTLSLVWVRGVFFFKKNLFIYLFIVIFIFFFFPAKEKHEQFFEPAEVTHPSCSISLSVGE